LVTTAADAAARAGIRDGDVILQLGNLPVPDVKAFEAALSKVDKSKPIGLVVRRGDLVQILVVHAGK
jgi:serine protease Do